MDLSCLTSLIREMPAYRQLVQRLRQGGDEQTVSALDAAQPYFVAALRQELHLPILVTVSSPEEAKKLYEQLLIWCGSEVGIFLLPEPDTLPYEHLAPDPSTEQQRLQVLFSLGEAKGKPHPNTEAPLVIGSASAVVRKTIPYTDFSSACHVLRQGMQAAPLELLSRWESMGYQRENLVEVPGTMSQRGGILDIYPPNSELPVRIEFFANQIESIRLFDPRSQRSLKSVPAVTLVPAQEAAWSNRGSLIDYLPPNSLLILDEPTDIESAIEELDVRASQLRQSQVEKGELLKDFLVPYFTYAELKAKFDGVKPRLILTRWSTESSVSSPHYHLPFAPAPSYGGQLRLFLKETKSLLRERQRVVIVSHQAARLSELFQEEDILVIPSSDIGHPPSPGSLALVQGSLSEGWIMKKVMLLTDAEIFGFVKQRRLIKKRPMPRESFLPQFSVGDYVVHIEHGIARFGGMTKMPLDDVEREYLTLEYAAGDRLYVPADQADRVSRYIGSGGEPPALSRLGTQEWARVKQRVKESAREMAQELLNLYAAREVIFGFAFSPDTSWQQELEASFPYIETPDQMETVQQVKQDMEKSKPMDRLVCGDVGYGKTEVALRAAFKAVMDGRQVAVLVPTTVLAQQHFTTFSQRLAAFPIRVEMLSRFRSEKEQRAILDGLASGVVDICIGTHRLLQKDVAFKDLGLVIVDEEQRFGVAHKEYLKQMRKEVDVLTLSATPIPRTLHMALVGVRDMSTMETPPEERLPIKTYVSEYNELLIREAIIRELERNGQVFFVHNRVQSIAKVAHRLKELVPEAEIAIGHGQMSEEELERTMLDFIQGKVDVLVCTTIIESGLDIPNVNTLIVNEADKLGLAQLYQLRGRVGRGGNRAYAYFLYRRGKHLTLAASKRLQTIFEATELGAGFRIAIKDLEIRGAGNLLGAEQSGHIAAVGFDLYCQLLSEAVEELKVKQVEEDRATPGISLTPLPLPTIDLPLSAYIPEDYVADTSTRLGLYQRLAKLRTPEEVRQIAEEFEDRFGKLPLAVENLFYLLNIRSLAIQTGVQSISKEDRQIVVRFKEGVKIDLERMRQAWHGLKVGTSQLRLDIRALGDRWKMGLEEVLKRL